MANDSLPEQLKQELLRTKKTTKELAGDIGISYASLQSYLTGRTQPGAKNRGILETYFEKAAKEIAEQKPEEIAAESKNEPEEELDTPLMTDYSIYMDESFDPDQQSRGNNQIVVSGILVPQLEEASSLKKFQNALYPFGWDKGDEVKAHFKTNDNIVKILQLSHDKYIDYAGLKTEKIPVLLTRNQANERFSQVFPYVRLLSELIGHTLAGKKLPQLNLTITMDHSPIIDENQLRMVRESIQKHLFLKYGQRSSIYITGADSKDRLGLQLADFLANYLNRVAANSIEPVIDLIPFNNDNSAMAQQFVYFYGLQDQRIQYSALAAATTEAKEKEAANQSPQEAQSTAPTKPITSAAATNSTPHGQSQVQSQAATNQLTVTTPNQNRPAVIQSNHSNNNNNNSHTPVPTRKAPIIHKLDAHLSRPVPTSTQHFTSGSKGESTTNHSTKNTASTDDKGPVAPKESVQDIEKVVDFLQELLPLTQSVLRHSPEKEQEEYKDTIKGLTTIIFNVLPVAMKGQLVTGKPRKSLQNITDLLVAVHNAEKTIPNLKIKDKHGQLTAARTILENTLEWAKKHNVSPVAAD